MVFSGVLFTVADRFLIIGIVMAIICLISWVTVPVGPLLSGIWPRARNWIAFVSRAVAVSAGVAIVLLILFGVVPFPYGFRAPGVVKDFATERSSLANRAAGRSTPCSSGPAPTVKRGQPLVQLREPRIGTWNWHAQARLEEVNARLLNAMQTESADISPLTQLHDAAAAQLKKLSTDKENLIVRAPHDGIWVAPGIEDYTGRWLPRGGNLGLVVNPASFEFVASVLQEDVDALFTRQIISGAVGVGLNGDAGYRDDPVKTLAGHSRRTKNAPFRCARLEGRR